MTFLNLKLAKWNGQNVTMWKIIAAFPNSWKIDVISRFTECHRKFRNWYKFGSSKMELNLFLILNEFVWLCHVIHHWQAVKKHMLNERYFSKFSCIQIAFTGRKWVELLDYIGYGPVMVFKLLTTDRIRFPIFVIFEGF